jgi:hypothetical protein
MKVRKADVAAPSALMVIAGLSHFYRIRSMPPGLGFDEAAVGLNTLETLRSGPRFH